MHEAVTILVALSRATIGFLANKERVRQQNREAEQFRHERLLQRQLYPEQSLHRSRVHQERSGVGRRRGKGSRHERPLLRWKIGH